MAYSATITNSLCTLVRLVVTSLDILHIYMRYNVHMAFIALCGYVTHDFVIVCVVFNENSALKMLLFGLAALQLLYPLLSFLLLYLLSFLYLPLPSPQICN